MSKQTKQSDISMAGLGVMGRNSMLNLADHWRPVSSGVSHALAFFQRDRGGRASAPLAAFAAVSSPITILPPHVNEKHDDT